MLKLNCCSPAPPFQRKLVVFPARVRLTDIEWQEEYGAEGLDVASIPFRDNEDIIDLICKRPFGLMAILEDQVRAARTRCVAESLREASGRGFSSNKQV